MMDSRKRLTLGLVVCAAGLSLASGAPRALVYEGDTTAMEWVLLDCSDNVAALTYSTALQSANNVCHWGLLETNEDN